MSKALFLGFLSTAATVTSAVGQTVDTAQAKHYFPPMAIDKLKIKEHGKLVNAFVPFYEEPNVLMPEKYYKSYHPKGDPNIEVLFSATDDDLSGGIVNSERTGDMVIFNNNYLDDDTDKKFVVFYNPKTHKLMSTYLHTDKQILLSDDGEDIFNDFIQQVGEAAGNQRKMRHIKLPIDKSKVKTVSL